MTANGTGQTTKYDVILDDVLRWAAGYTGEPYHAIFADPPYHLTSITKRFGKPDSAPAKGGVYRRSSAGFMGAQWDGEGESGLGIAFNPETWAALAQHLHPGGFILAFAGTRGYHRMACAMEDSGLIIHPAMVWTFLSGFPKATQISNQIDRAAGNVRPDKLEGGHIGLFPGDSANEKELKNTVPHVIGKGSFTNGTPIEPLAQTWAGHRYGLQALKPALEFIAVAQKPYEGRPVDCITRTGAGAFNIDAARIETNGETWEGNLENAHNDYSAEVYGKFDLQYAKPSNPLGRWPANLLLSEEGAELLDRQSGEIQSHPPGNTYESPTTKSVYGQYSSRKLDGYNDSGGASRMFFTSDWSYEILEQLENADPLKYEPKVSTSEREAGLDGLKNNHPTLKPISLTKYLATLILPPDAYAPRRLLCPFSGSGSEMAGAILAGWEEVTGIESNPDYHEISKARLAWWSQWPGWGQTDVDKILASLADEAPAEQLSFLEVA